jgi:hypothetical protein
MNSPERRTDFYTLFHKGLRRRLFDLICATGATDVGDQGAAAALGRRLDDLFALLELHAQVEETFVHPFYAKVAPELLAQLEGDHHAHEAQAHQLRAEAARITAAGDGAAALAFYRALVRFVADYLHHLDLEEASLPLLWERVSEPELAQAFVGFQRSRTPAQLTMSWELMLPAMTPIERAEMAQAIAAAAPPPVTALFRAAARAALDAGALADLVRRVPAIA